MLEPYATRYLYIISKLKTQDSQVVRFCARKKRFTWFIILRTPLGRKMISRQFDAFIILFFRLFRSHKSSLSLSLPLPLPLSLPLSLLSIFPCVSLSLPLIYQSIDFYPPTYSPCSFSYCLRSTPWSWWPWSWERRCSWARTAWVRPPPSSLSPWSAHSS